MTTMTNRSEYLGVYHNTSDESREEVPFRVAIKLMRKGVAKWVNLGYVKSERVAARIYNVYAINFFGKGAILNEVDLTPEEVQEYNAFINKADKPKRLEQHNKACLAARRINDAGMRFKKHHELEGRTDAAPPATEPAQQGMLDMPA